MAARALDARLTWTAMQALGRVSTRLGGVAAARLWFTPWNTETESQLRREREWLAQTEPARWTTSEGTLTGFTAGEGPVALLVHGWSERAAMLGGFIAPLVDAGYRVVGVDMPGHGPEAARDTDVIKMENGLREVAELEGPVRVVVAHSLGSLIAARLLEQGLTPERVVLLGPVVRLRHTLREFVRMFRVPSKAATGLAEEFERRFGKTVWTDFSTDEIAPRLTVPVLIVHDRTDNQVRFVDGEHLASVWPDAKLVATDGLGHNRILRDPEVISEAVAFLSRVPA